MLRRKKKKKREKERERVHARGKSRAAMCAISRADRQDGIKMLSSKLSRKARPYSSLYLAVPLNEVLPDTELSLTRGRGIALVLRSLTAGY